MTGERVIVVGCGVAGASCAYALARRGANVTCVDSGRAGIATAAGAGIIAPWGSTAASDAAWFGAYLDGARYYPELVARLAEDAAGDIGYARTGSMIVSAEASVLDGVEQRLAQHTDRPEMGDVRRVAPTQARELFPPLAPELAGVHVAGGGRVDGRRLRAALQGGARRHSAQFVEGDATLEISGTQVVGVRVGEQLLAADMVVVAAGAWTNELLSPVGVVLPVEPQRGQIVHLRLPDVETGSWPSIHPLNEHYMVCFDDRVAVGATRETGSGFDVRVTAGGLHQVLSAALTIAPGLADATHLETRVGLRPLVPDHTPQVGLVPGVAGLAVISGFGAGGLTMGPYIGASLAAQLCGEHPELDLSPFTPAGAGRTAERSA